MTTTQENNAQHASHIQLTAQLLATLNLETVGEDVFLGQSFDYVGARIFGGQVLAQALMAGAKTLSTPKPCHSLHGYFLRGGDIHYPVHYEVARLRDGRSLSARQITAVQYIDGKRQVIFAMMASFSPMDELGLHYQSPMPDYPSPDSLKSEQELKADYLHKVPHALQERFMRERHVLIKPITQKDPIFPEPMPPKQATWLAIPALSDETVAIHQALLAFASDFYLAGTGLMSHGLTYSSAGLQVASIDHAMHFHRPFDIRNWLLYEMKSDTTSYDKGLNLGQFWQDGNLVASTSQEGLMRLHGSEL